LRGLTQTLVLTYPFGKKNNTRRVGKFASSRGSAAALMCNVTSPGASVCHSVCSFLTARNRRSHGVS
jgi:hypothetical protein